MNLVRILKLRLKHFFYKPQSVKSSESNTDLFINL